MSKLGTFTYEVERNLKKSFHTDGMFRHQQIIVYTNSFHTDALEVGCVFKNLLQLLKTTDRQKILSLFKIIMILLWGKNKQAKYP